MVGDDLAESVINSVSRPPKRSCIKISNAEFRFGVVGSSSMMVVMVELSLRTLAPKLSVQGEKQVVLLFLRCIIFLVQEAYFVNYE